MALIPWGLLWFALLVLWVQDVPVDNAEQLTWVRSLQWGYHKHPPLPTWLMAPMVFGFGLQAWVSMVMGALLKLASLALWWDLLRRLLGPQRAAIGLVCACCVAYYSSRLHYYSHNEVMLACSVGSAWSLWRAWAEGRWRHWLLLGFFLGLGLLAKYQAVTTVASALAFCLLSPSADAGLRRARWQGMLVALMVAALLVLPHGLWLMENAHTPLSYAANSTIGADLGIWQRARQVGVWLGDLLVRGAGAAVLLVLVGRWSRGLSTPTEAPSATEVQARTLLICWALLPLVVVMAMALLGGAMIRPHWATPMALWIVAAMLVRLPRALEQGGLGEKLGAWLCVALAVQLMLAAQVGWNEHRNQVAPARWGQPMVSRWASEVAEAARAELGGDIRVVIAPETVAASLAIALPERPYAVLDGRLEISPWVRPELIDRCGALFVTYGPPSPERTPIALGPQGLAWSVARPSDGRGCSGDQKRP